MALELEMKLASTLRVPHARHIRKHSFPGAHECAGEPQDGVEAEVSLRQVSTLFQCCREAQTMNSCFFPKRPMSLTS